MSKVLRSSPLEAKNAQELPTRGSKKGCFLEVLEYFRVSKKHPFGTHPHPSCRGRLSDAFARCLAEAESAALVESGA